MANHKHQCLRCGCIWQHPDSRKNEDAAHRCPSCGNPTWTPYAGKLAPQFIDPLTEEGRDARSRQIPRA